MKKQMFASVMTMGLLLVLIAVSAHAQELLVRQITVDVPFAFSVGQETLPAGTYVVSETPTTIMLRSTDGRQTVRVLAMWKTGNGQKNGAKLVFHRYGEQYFLSEVWLSAYGRGSELGKARAEREVARKIEQKKAVLTASRE